MRILIAEDDLVSRKILTIVLTKWGYTPVPVNNGLAAWEVMQKPDAPKMAILDWNMPGMEGVDVCRKIREMETPEPPYLIMLTSKTDKSDIVAGLDAGGNDFISKPYDNAELEARINVGQRMIELQSSLNQAKEEMAHLAMHDPLTGIFNRAAIISAIGCEIARAKRMSGRLSLGMLDIDHFKQVNDTYGHQIGDDVLCGVVKRIQSSLREYDKFGRYGGEEFLVVAPESTGSAEESLYQRLCDYVSADPIKTRDNSIHITVSIGVASWNVESTVDNMLARADVALYRAKDDGRNRVVNA